MQQYYGTVLLNQWVSSRYKHLAVHAPGITTGCTAGQFFHLRCTDGFVPLLRRPMSIYRIVPEQDELHFLYHVKGAGTQLLAEMRQGDRLDMFGPLGHGFTLDPKWKTILILARGVGLATLTPLVQLAGKQGVKVYAVLSARTESDILSATFMRDCGAKVLTVTDESGTSDVDDVQHMLEALIEKHEVDALFTCGSKRLTYLLQSLALKYNLPGQVALEENMGCGMGMCYCCVKKFNHNGTPVNLRVCKDGPVFSLKEVMNL